MAEVTASQSADGRSDRRKLVALHRLKKLRQDLIQYNPDPETLNQIVATLRP